MVSRWGYADNWDAFMEKLKDYSAEQMRTMVEECQRENGRIGMIVELGLEWRTRQSGAREVEKSRERRRALAEAVRWIRVDRELMPYVDVRTRALMPERRIHHVSHPERRRLADLRWNFFTSLDRGGWRGRSVEQIIARTYRFSPQLWAAAHPYGPPPSAEQVRALRASMARCRPRSIRRHDGIVMSPERATAVALHILSRIA